MESSHSPKKSFATLIGSLVIIFVGLYPSIQVDNPSFIHAGWISNLGLILVLIGIFYFFRSLVGLLWRPLLIWWTTSPAARRINAVLTDFFTRLLTASDWVFCGLLPFTLLLYCYSIAVDSISLWHSIFIATLTSVMIVLCVKLVTLRLLFNVCLLVSFGYFITEYNVFFHLPALAVTHIIEPLIIRIMDSLPNAILLAIAGFAMIYMLITGLTDRVIEWTKNHREMGVEFITHFSYTERNEALFKSLSSGIGSLVAICIFIYLVASFFKYCVLISLIFIVEQYFRRIVQYQFKYADFFNQYQSLKYILILLLLIFSWLQSKESEPTIQIHPTIKIEVDDANTATLSEANLEATEPAPTLSAPTYGAISIKNASFEESHLTSKVLWQWGAQGWEGERFGILAVSGEYFVAGQAPEGRNVAFLSKPGAYIQQTLAVSVNSSSEYILRCAIGLRADEGFNSGRVKLELFSGRVILSSIIATLPAKGEFKNVDLKAQYNPRNTQLGLNDNEYGEPLSIRISNIDAIQVNVDVVQVTSRPRTE